MVPRTPHSVLDSRFNPISFASSHFLRLLKLRLPPILSEMSSPIECLPTGLLDIMAGHLSLADLGHLLQTSKHIHRCIEPPLYASQDSPNQAMFWACKNARLSTIHLAISSGADVRLVHVPRPRLGRLYSGLPDAIPVSTLQLAAKYHHVDAFAVLLELGAQIDESGLLTDRVSHATAFTKRDPPGPLPQCKARRTKDSKQTCADRLRYSSRSGLPAQLQTWLCIFLSIATRACYKTSNP
jgi:hypothetical protein